MAWHCWLNVKVYLASEHTKSTTHISKTPFLKFTPNGTVSGIKNYTREGVGHWESLDYFQFCVSQLNL